MPTRLSLCLATSVLAFVGLVASARAEGSLFDKFIGMDDVDRGLYLATLGGSSTVEATSSGYNGSFRNYGGSDDEDLAGGLAIGTRLSTDHYGKNCFARLELEGVYLGDRNFQTHSCVAPPNTPPMYFDVGLSGLESGLANFFFDIPLRDNFGLYLGSGMGGANYDVVIDDGMVRGADSVTSFAAQYAFGVNCYLTPRLVLDLSWRHMEYGKANIALYDKLAASPQPEVGNYKLSLSSENLFVTLRYDLF